MTTARIRKGRTLSLVVPMHNEAEGLDLLFGRLDAALHGAQWSSTTIPVVANVDATEAVIEPFATSFSASEPRQPIALRRCFSSRPGAGLALCGLQDRRLLER